MHRSASPALSENDVDISKSLFRDDSSNGPDSDAEIEVNSGSFRAKLDATAADTEDEDEAFIAAAQAAANREKGGKPAQKTSPFQAMGMNSHLVKAINRLGFKVPTPIQKLTIPKVLDGRDVVGMARTGSGKTAAFVIPMIEKLKAHSVKVGARAIILSPTRELALQTLKVVKDFGKGTDLRTVLLVGGESLEDQFSSMAGNPDIVIATPARLEHLKIEMALDLSSVKYVVFDEADRLFEKGFEGQLYEIMHSMPTSRQTLLFSATLPTSLVEFARAGLRDPIFERLDAESKIPPGLESAFFTVKRSEREGALLHILQDVIRLPSAGELAARRSNDATATGSKKRKRGVTSHAVDAPSPESTIVFTATKYHVEYLTTLLRASGFAASFVYGTLDQEARRSQLLDFRTGKTNVLIVTDVAARGLDLPLLANVINHDFPSQPKAFVHRVGRTARAGKSGWSYSLATTQDMPCLIDLQLFLGRELITGRAERSSQMFKNAVVVGALGREKLDRSLEEITKLLEDDEDLAALRDVAGRAEMQYRRNRSAASAKSVKNAKQLMRTDDSKSLNMLFDIDDTAGSEQQRMAMLARVSGFRPQETVFEIGKKSNSNETAAVMRKRRANIEQKYKQKDNDEATDGASDPLAPADGIPSVMDIDSDDELVLTGPGMHMDEESDDGAMLAALAPNGALNGTGTENAWQDAEHFMGYTPSGINMAEERGFGVNSGSNVSFVEATRSAAMDLVNDETKAFGEASRPKGLRWDKSGKKYVSLANDEDGSKGKRTMRSESGQKIPASFRSGRFDAWRKANKVDRLPGVGEIERKGARFAQSTGPRYKHKSEKAPKEADKYRDDYLERKKRVGEAKEKRIGRFAEGKGKNELKDVDHVRKARNLKSKKREKNARPSRKT